MWEFEKGKRVNYNEVSGDFNETSDDFNEVSDVWGESRSDFNKITDVTGDKVLANPAFNDCNEIGGGFNKSTVFREDVVLTKQDFTDKELLTQDRDLSRDTTVVRYLVPEIPQPVHVESLALPGAGPNNSSPGASPPDDILAGTSSDSSSISDVEDYRELGKGIKFYNHLRTKVLMKM